jgi:putative CocE/NonD family hydrolase
MTPTVHVEFDVPAPMRDGTVLRADLYRPAEGGPWPCLLVRTPYDKQDPTTIAWLGIDPVRAASRGFIVVLQDTRGRFASEGEWEPFRFEERDGYDSVEWAATLPDANGRVGMFGGSYDGNTQLLAARARPPALDAIAPALTWSDPLNGFFARGGALELGATANWLLETGVDYVTRESTGNPEKLLEDWRRLGTEGYWHLPAEELAAVRRHAMPGLELLSYKDQSQAAKAAQVVDSYDRIDVPTFHTAGWYDVFLQGSLDNHQELIRRGRESRLIVGPWSHVDFADPFGERVLGFAATRDGVPVHHGRSWADLQLEWFQRHLVPGSAPESAEAPVRIFVMGIDEWRDEPAWPLERAHKERWFLAPEGGLSPVNEPGQAVSEFFYDPAEPVPTLGGATLMPADYPAGPVDQAELEIRGDVLVFSSGPLEEALEVTGRVRVVLHAESSAPSTDWVARLCDVDPDGRSFNLCDGVVRVREGADRGGRYEIDLWSTSNVFLPGHRLRVHVTSDSFPRWDRNLNTGNQRDASGQVARQRIYHGGDRPSYLELPVIE